MSYLPMYISAVDLENAMSKKFVIETSDDDRDGTEDAAVILEAIRNGESRVNAYLMSGGYTVPVATPIPSGGEIVQTASIWFALSALAARRNVIPDEIKDQLNWIMKLMDKVVSHLVVLPLPAGEGGVPHSTTLGQEKIFTRSKFDKGTGSVRNPDENHTLDVEGMLGT